MRKALLPLALCFALTSCATRPATEDVTSFYLLDIVQSIRCETRDAFKEALVGIILDKDDDYFEDPVAKALAVRMKNGADINILDTAPIGKKLVDILDRLEKAAVIYDFRFEISEQNEAGGTLTLSDPISRGLLNIGLNSSIDATRKAARTFRIADVFGEFRDNKFAKRCASRIARGRFANKRLYPVTGKLGIAEILRNYLLLVETAGLARSDNEVGENIRSTYIEKLTYTTIFKAGAEPMLVLTRLPDGLNVSGLDSHLRFTRTDAHEVSLAFYLAPKRGETNAAIPADELDRQQFIDALDARPGF